MGARILKNTLEDAAEDLSYKQDFKNMVLFILLKRKNNVLVSSINSITIISPRSQLWTSWSVHESPDESVHMTYDRRGSSAAVESYGKAEL